MKKILILACCVSLFFSACSKSDNNTPTTPTNNGNNNNTNNPATDTSMKYIINGLGDVTMETADTAHMGLTINLEKGNQEKVTLAVTNLPEKVTSSFSTQSGIPSFSTLLTLESKGAKSGSYPIKVTGTTAFGAVKSYDLTLKINEKPLDPAYLCINTIEGNFVGKYDNKQYSIQIIRGADNKSVIVKNFPEPGIEIPAHITCSAKALYFPQSSYQNHYFSNGPGGASFFNDPNNFTLSITYQNGGASQPEYITLTLTR